MFDNNVDIKSIYRNKDRVVQQRGKMPQSIKFCDVWTGSTGTMILTISNNGEVWINPDLKFSNLTELKTDYLLALRALVNKAITEKLQ